MKSAAKKTDSQLLLNAADHLSKVGHVKGDLIDKYGRVCLQGAINYAVSGNANWPTDVSQEERGIKLLEDVRVALGLASTVLCIFWNNAPSTTQQQVVDALRKAAGACE